MSGLVGFTRDVAGSHEPSALLHAMQTMMVHFSHNHRDGLWCEGLVCATRVYNDIGQPGPQPLSLSGTVFVWMDGVLYNRAEVAAQNHLPEPPSAGTLLLQLYERDGNLDFLRQVDGLFSAVIYDAARQQVHLTTDRYGLRRLHWTVHRGGLWWGSEVKLVRALADRDLRIDRQTARDFTEAGSPFGPRTWLEGVQRLDIATVLTWDIPSRTVNQRPYWWWDSIQPQPNPLSLDEAAEELGHRFIQAVRRRSWESRVNVELSGGLDSRAILASIAPDREVHAYTSGQKGCGDTRISAMAARTRGAAHHVYEIDGANWLDKTTLHDIWRLDGESGIAQVVGSRAHGHFLEEAPVRLNGMGGNVMPAGFRLRADLLDVPISHAAMTRRLHYGGFDLDFSRYANLPKIDFAFLDNRERRYVGGAVHAARTHGEIHLPWYDNRVVEFIYSLSDRLRWQKRLYYRMLLRHFPDYFETIPLLSIGIPISNPVGMGRLQRLPRKAHRVFFQYAHKWGWTEYKHNDSRYPILDAPRWIRQEPGRSFFAQVLLNPQAIYPDYIPRQQVIDTLHRHWRGEHLASQVLYYASAELWFQQVFEGKYRPET